MIDRVTRTVSVSLRRGVQRVRLQLHPPELGMLRIHLTLEGDQLKADMQVQSQAARQMLINHLPTLERSLAGHGIEVRHFQVQVTPEDTQTTWHDQPGNGQRPSDQGQDGQPDTSDDEPDAPGDEPDVLPLADQSGVSSRLNLVA